MDILTLSKKAVEILVGSIIKSKGTRQASDEMSTAIWDWLKPIFLKDDSPISDLKENPENRINQQDVVIKIQKYINSNKDEFERLQSIIKSSIGNVDSDGNTINIQNSTISTQGNINIVGGNQIK